MPKTAKDWGWPIGPPPTSRVRFAPPGEGDPQRCQARNAKKLQCSRWRMKGCLYCKTHHRRPKAGTRGKAMRSYYARAAPSALRQRLEAVIGESIGQPDEYLSLQGEVELARVSADQSLRLFSAACLGPGSEDISEEHKTTAIDLLRKSLAFVASLVEKAAKARALSSEVIRLEQLGMVTEQFTRAIEEEFGEESPAITARLLTRLQKIQLPQAPLRVEIR